ncbi:MAG: InlB B-repeat-containing protein, partial [Chitinispirillales bacterium]|nr:InlB B-repeat-containing protein [Chitinispirillales bacterium]
MQNKSRFLKVAAMIAALCVAGNAADYEPNETWSSGAINVCAHPAIVEAYVLGAGGGGEGGYKYDGISSKHTGSGCGGGGGAATYAKLRVIQGAEIKFLKIGGGGGGGSSHKKSTGGWVSGYDGGDGGNSEVMIYGITINANGGKGGGTTTWDCRYMDSGTDRDAGGCGGEASGRPNSSLILDFVSKTGDRGGNGCMDCGVNTFGAGGRAGSLTGIPGYSTSFGGGYSGGSGVHWSTNDGTGYPGAAGSATVYVTYLWNVTFNSNGGSPTPSSISEIYNGGKISAPSDNPKKEYYSFRGWFTDAACTDGKQWDFENSKVKDNITLYAKWVDLRLGDIAAITKDKFYTYDGTEKYLETIDFYNSETEEWITLEEGEDNDFTATYENNINSGTAKATVTGKGERGQRMGVKEISFEIRKREVKVSWENTAFIYNSNEQIPTPTSGDSDFPVNVINTDFPSINAGNNCAYAGLTNQDTNVILSGITRTYTISPKDVRVIWGDEREFVYNKMIQHPTWSLESNDIGTNHVYIAPTYAVVGEYTVANGLAPVVRIVDEYNTKIYHNNYTLVNTRVDYEIVKKELDVVLKKNGNIVEEVEVAKGDINTVGDVQNALKA